MTVVVNNQTKDRQMFPSILLTDKFIYLLVLVLTKLKKYEEVGRVDKGMLIIKHISSILYILKYWYYSGIPYKDLPECMIKGVECNLSNIKGKLNILPRDLWIDISTLLVQAGYVIGGIDDLEIIGIDKDNTLTDFQII